jgi:hypothetical protein
VRVVWERGPVRVQVYALGASLRNMEAAKTDVLDAIPPHNDS